MNLRLSAWTQALALGVSLLTGHAAQAQEATQTVEQVASSVTLTSAADLVITSATPLAGEAVIDIRNADAAIVFTSVRPSAVIRSWLGKITCNGARLTAGDNCLVSIYGNGAILLPHSDKKNADGTPFYPVTMYADDDFTEPIGHYNSSERQTLGEWKDKARSFTLKRGYMCTVANDAAGTGYSHCYIANSSDLRVRLPKALAGKLGFFRIFRWQWPSKLGMSDSRSESTRFGTNATWYYDWGAGRSSLADAEYVPQRHHEAGQSNSNGYKGAWESWTNINASDNTCTHVLGQNEPDNTGGGNEVYTYVTSIPANPREKHGDYPLTDVAKEFLYSGKRIGTFACCNPNTGWVSEYVNWCRDNNIRVDFVATHYYIGGQSPQGCIDRLWQLHNATGLPVWVTEWNNGANWTSESGFTTDSEGWYSWGTGNDQHKNGVWLKDVLVRADKPENRWLERLAVYNAVEAKREIETGGRLTDAGKVLGTYRSGLAYNDANEYFMPWNHKAPSNLSLSFNAARRTATLTWTHSNSKQTDSICVQRKTAGGAYRTIRKLELQESGQLTLTDDLGGIKGLVSYRICDYDTDSQRRYSDEAEVSIGAAEGFAGFQYGNLTLANTDKVRVEYTDPFDDQKPCVFTGGMTNANTRFHAGNLVENTSRSGYFTYAARPWNTDGGELAKSETVPFLALTPGTHQFGALACEVGTALSNPATTDKWSDITRVEFSRPFPEGIVPVVLAEIQNPSYQNYTSLSVRVFDVTHKGFSLIVYPEDTYTQNMRLRQTVAYIAIEPGMDWASEETGILIAAGHGTDNQVYGSSSRTNSLTTTEGAPLKLISPTLLTALQTNNYPTAAMLRCDPVTERDETGSVWVTGFKSKRICDHDILIDGEDVPSVSALNKHAHTRDNVSWIAIATSAQGWEPGSTGLTSPGVETGREVFDLSGNLLMTLPAATASPRMSLPPGLHILRSGGKSTKILTR